MGSQACTKIVLVSLAQPRSFNNDAVVGCPQRYENMGQLYIASNLKEAGFEVRLIDEHVNPQDLARLDGRTLSNLLFLGFSVLYQESIEKVFKLVRWSKSLCPGLTIVLGGICPTNWNRTILEECPEIDIIVRGEGEETTRLLAVALHDATSLLNVPGITFRYNNRVIRNEAAPIPDIEKLPFPDRGFLKTGVIEEASVITTRGCPHSCSFCCLHSLTGTHRWRARSADNVAQELALVHSMGVHRICVMDAEVANTGKAFVRRWKIIADKLLKLGCEDLKLRFALRLDVFDDKSLRELPSCLVSGVFWGVENISPSVQVRICKEIPLDRVLHVLDVLVEMGIECGLGFIPFFPFSTLKSIEENVAFLERVNGKAYVPFPYRRFIPYAGASLFDEMRTQGKLRQISFGEFDYSFDSGEVQALYEALQRDRIYFMDKIELGYWRCVKPGWDLEGHIYRRLVSLWLNILRIRIAQVRANCLSSLPEFPKELEEERIAIQNLTRTDE